MKIDDYSHILPRAYFDRLVEIAPDQGAIKRWLTIPVLHDPLAWRLSPPLGNESANRRG